MKGETVDTVSANQGQRVGRGYAVPRSMTTIRYRQLRETGAHALVERPGLQRFRNLPEPVANAVLGFLEEVRLSTPEYGGAHSRAWRDFLQRFSLIFFEPFQSPRHFAQRDTLSEGELIRYAENLIGALRPIVLALRENETTRSGSALELVVDREEDEIPSPHSMRA